MANNSCGFLAIDKPLRITSRDAVDRAARWFPRGTRLGHTGTLDPLATGVLVLAVGYATRFAEYVQRMEKVYRAGIRLGARSDTDDAEGRIMPSADTAAPDLAAIEAVLPSFTGEIQQTPPAFSAAKVTGRRAYELARRGKEVRLEPRPVHVYEIRLLRYQFPDLELEVRCGKGTYIRSLARDLGDRLGCGGYVAALRRTRVGSFDEATAVSLDADAMTALDAVRDLSLAAADLPRVTLSPGDVDKFRHGQAVAAASGAGDLGVFDTAGAFVGIGVATGEGHVRPDKVVARDD